VAKSSAVVLWHHAVGVGIPTKLILIGLVVVQKQVSQSAIWFLAAAAVVALVAAVVVGFVLLLQQAVVVPLLKLLWHLKQVNML
jgi:hypothetical protein